MGSPAVGLQEGPKANKAVGDEGEKERRDFAEEMSVRLLVRGHCESATK